MREFIISTDSTNDLPEAYLKENKDLALEVENAIREKHNLPLGKDTKVQEGEVKKEDKTNKKGKLKEELNNNSNKIIEELAVEDYKNEEAIVKEINI